MRRKLTQICNTIDAITSANTNVIYVYYKTMQRVQRDKGMKTDDVTIPHNVGSCITMMYLFLGISALFLSLKKHTNKNFMMILKCQSSLFVLGLTQELTVKHK